jgi:hypothetical protein
MYNLDEDGWKTLHGLSELGIGAIRLSVLQQLSCRMTAGALLPPTAQPTSTNLLFAAGAK